MATQLKHGLTGLIGGYGSDDEDDLNTAKTKLPSAGAATTLTNHDRTASSIVAYDSDDDQQAVRPPVPVSSKPVPVPSKPLPKSPEKRTVSSGTNLNAAASAPVPMASPPLKPPVESDAQPMDVGEPAAESNSNAPALPPSNRLQQRLCSHPNAPPLRSLLLLPPEPPGRPDEAVQARFREYISTSEQKGITLNQSLNTLKQFHNPSILERIAKKYKIDQTGTNYPPEVWNPKALPAEDFYEAIAQEQKKYEEKLLQDRMRGGAIEFTVPAMQPATLQAPSMQPGLGLATDIAAATAKAKALALAAEVGRKRKNWDAPPGDAANANGPASAPGSNATSSDGPAAKRARPSRFDRK